MSSQSFTLDRPLFLIHLNNLADDVSNAKLFTDDTSLFSVVCNVNISANEVNNDLVKNNEWVYQWTMSFNPDPIN